MSEQAIRGNHNPGAGGWPTIKYFNKATGIEGKAYEKKTSKSMCDELGDNGMIEDYIVEAAQIVLCDVATGAGCSDKENAFIATWGSKPLTAISAEKDRLSKMEDAKVKGDVKAWQKSRVKLLTALSNVAHNAAGGSSEL